MKRIFSFLTISDHLLKLLLMLPYPPAAVNKQALSINLSGDPAWFTHLGSDNERETLTGQIRFDDQQVSLSTKALAHRLTRCRKHRVSHLSLRFSRLPWCRT